MSASTNDVLAHPGAAVRQQPRHAGGPGQRHDRHLRRPRQPVHRAARRGRFRTAALDHIQCGHVDCDAGRARPRARTSACTASRSTTGSTTTCGRWKQYRRFRDRGRAQGLSALSGSVRSQRAAATCRRQGAGVHQRSDRPHAGRRGLGRAAGVLEDRLPRAEGDGGAGRLRPAPGGRHLGGGAGTTYDAFKLIAEAQKYGARAALFGRKINNAENQLGVRAVPAADRRRRDLARRGGAGLSRRAWSTSDQAAAELEDDLMLQTGVMSYGGGSSACAGLAVPGSCDRKPMQCIRAVAVARNRRTATASMRRLRRRRRLTRERLRSRTRARLLEDDKRRKTGLEQGRARPDLWPVIASLATGFSQLAQILERFL